MCKARLTASRRIQAIFNWLPDCQTAILIPLSFKRFPRRRAQLTPLPSFLALSGSANIELVFNNTSIYNHLFSSEFGYTEFTFNVTASFPTSFLQFVFGNGNAGTFYLDDVSVEPAVASVPDGGTTTSLLGCALLGLAGLRRKWVGKAILITSRRSD